MAGNRKLLFGYRMERGEVTEHPIEAEAVREIFQRYLAGASYAALVEHLRDTGPAYDGNKLWNKNMVARILENTKYTGDSGFLPVISQETFHKAQVRRKERAVPPTKTPAQKELRRLCGGNPPKYVIGQVLGILNRLTADPGLIRVSVPEWEEPAQTQALHQKLEELLKEAPADETAARQTAPDYHERLLRLLGEGRRQYRIMGQSWWLEELPSKEEYAEAGGIWIPMAEWWITSSPTVRPAASQKDWIARKMR